MNLKITLFTIEIKTEQKKKGSAQPKPTPSQSLKNTINITQK